MGLDEDTRRWVESISGRRIDDCERLFGGLSSEVYRCQLDGFSAVVRHIVDQDWLAREPDLIDREAETLGLLEGSAVPGPRLLGADARSGRLLMSFVRGSVRAEADHICNCVEAIANMAASIAQVPLKDGHTLPRWRSWVPSEPRPPGWGNENVWHEAIDRYRLATQPEPDRSVLLHRDFHPLNLLWEDGAIVGVVDWVNACTGHPHAELGHCRWNLTALAGLEAADQFLAHYLRATGSGPYDYWWDLTAALGFLDWPVAVQAWQAVGRTDITDATIARVTNAFLRAALDHLHLA